MCESCGWELVANDIETMRARGEIPQWATHTLDAVLAIIDERRHVTVEQVNFVDGILHEDNGEAGMY